MSLDVVLRRVTKSHGHDGAGPVVLDGIDLDVSAGEFVSVMGPSGSGKSTLLNVIAGLDPPTSGSVVIAGRDLAGLSDDARSDLRLRHVGFVFQGFNLLPTLTVEENLMWPLELLGHANTAARARTREMLARVDLAPRTFARRPAELSGGELQRAAIARALVTSAQLLLADEPTGNLDSRSGGIVLDLLRKLNREERVTVVMVTHDPLAAAYGDRTVELRDGRIVRDVRARVVHELRSVPPRDL